MAKFEFGEYSFRTKAEAKTAIQKIVSQYRDGEILSQPHYAFIIALVAAHHRHAKEKLKYPVSVIVVRTNPVYKALKGFWLRYEDGTECDVSWTKCLSPIDHKGDVRAACRVAIKRQIVEAREFLMMLDDTCPITGDAISFKNCHVDHHPVSFLAILESWLLNQGYGYEDVKVSETVPGETETFLVDGIQLISWQNFHNKHAQYRLVSPRAGH